MRHKKELKLAFIMLCVQIILGIIILLFLSALGLGTWSFGVGTKVYGPKNIDLYTKEAPLFAGFNALMTFVQIFVGIILFFCFIWYCNVKELNSRMFILYYGIIIFVIIFISLAYLIIDTYLLSYP